MALSKVLVLVIPPRALPSALTFYASSHLIFSVPLSSLPCAFCPPFEMVDVSNPATEGEKQSIT